MKPVVTLTEAARKRMIHFVRYVVKHDILDKSYNGVHLTIKGKGCAGFSYVMKPASGPDPTDPAADVIQLEEDIYLYVDSTAILYIMGLEIDWSDELMQGGWVFNNPNATGSCGCGESFNV